MKQKTKIVKPGYRVISSDIDGFDSLADFALTATRSAVDFTPRIIPNFAEVSVPLEATLILWQR
jgi:hypothetical protein